MRFLKAGKVGFGKGRRCISGYVRKIKKRGGRNINIRGKKEKIEKKNIKKPDGRRGQSTASRKNGSNDRIGSRNRFQTCFGSFFEMGVAVVNIYGVYLHYLIFKVGRSWGHRYPGFKKRIEVEKCQR